MNDDASVLIRVCSRLRRHRVLLVAHRSPHVDVAVLKHRHGVPEYEVYGSVYVAITVELTVRVHVQRVLVPLEAAPVEHRVVGAGPERHRLVLLRPRCVLERHVPSDEPVTGNRCNDNIQR